MVTHLEERIIEARLLEKIRQRLAWELGKEGALAIISETLQKDAHEAGAAFAATAEKGPGLKHFSTIVDTWSRGQTLQLGMVRLDENDFYVTVEQCGFMKAYAELGLSADFCRILSCDRDHAFAQGYSSRLTLRREEYIGIGSARCLFHYTWT